MARTTSPDTEPTGEATPVAPASPAVPTPPRRLGGVALAGLIAGGALAGGLLFGGGVLLGAHLPHGPAGGPPAAAAEHRGDDAGPTGPSEGRPNGPGEQQGMPPRGDDRMPPAPGDRLPLAPGSGSDQPDTDPNTESGDTGSTAP